MHIIMAFRPNKTPVEIIKEGAFGGTFFRDIYSSTNDKWYRNPWKEFNELKNINQKYYCSYYCDVSANKYKVKCGTSLKFWESIKWIISLRLVSIVISIFIRYQDL